MNCRRLWRPLAICSGSQSSRAPPFDVDESLQWTLSHRLERPAARFAGAIASRSAAIAASIGRSSFVFVLVRKMTANPKPATVKTVRNRMNRRPLEDEAIGYARRLRTTMAKATNEEAKTGHEFSEPFNRGSASAGASVAVTSNFDRLPRVSWSLRQLRRAVQRRATNQSTEYVHIAVVINCGDAIFVRSATR